ncbi:MAG TPA: hypothetical protein VJA16_18145, partial [Thermoanaerobaculia bacterium]
MKLPLEFLRICGRTLRHLALLRGPLPLLSARRGCLGRLRLGLLRRLCRCMLHLSLSSLSLPPRCLLPCRLLPRCLLR